MDAEEKPDPVGELEGFHGGWTPGELLFLVNGSDIISSIPEHWKPGTNVLTHHKGKISDTCNLFVHHCKPFPNPLNCVMVPGANPLKTFPPEASSFYASVTQWCHGPIWGGDYADGRGDDQRVSRRKMRIPQTNHGKNDKKFGRTLISYFCIITTFFHCKFSVFVFPLGKKRKKEHCSFRQQETKNTRGTRKEVENNDFTMLSCSSHHCPWSAICISITVIPLPLRINLDKHFTQKHILWK